MKVVIDIGENLYTRLFDMRANTMRDMRASKAESEVENKKEKHTCISCRFYRYDRRTWPCDDCLDYDRWKEVEE